MYTQGLERNSANFAALTPIDFIARAAAVYPQRLAIVHGALRQDWATTYRRCRQLASALQAAGVGRGDTVSVMLPNTPAMVEVHFGVPMSGAVLNTLNTRLEPEALAFMLDHAQARVLLVDREFVPVMRKALALCQVRPLLIDVSDPEFAVATEPLGNLDYDAFVAGGDAEFAWQPPADEFDAICLNYTSGTTGNPKGVVYHHRGAYLNAVGNAIEWDMPKHPVYLWTLPMFHCNGWCFPWTVAARAGVNVCLRKVDPALIFELIRSEGVTHYCGAPIVHSTLLNAPEPLRAGISHTVKAMVAGAAPPAAMIEGMEQMGFDITHVYGLTETYGPAAVCAKQDDWQALPVAERARLNARQGVRYHLQAGMDVLDPQTMTPVPHDGSTMGEIMFRGNITMKGYLKNPKASDEAFAGGWFHSGDLAVIEPDGYVKIKDRSKDIIISGGENISSIEVEDVLYRHPAVMVAAVVAKSDPKWGETPVAYIELRAGATATVEDIISHCRAHLAGFKVPKTIVFSEIPKTSTGKIQKFELRKRSEQQEK